MLPDELMTLEGRRERFLPVSFVSAVGFKYLPIDWRHPVPMGGPTEELIS